jgi:hypothetical protein
MINGRCRMHGGKSLAGPASGTFKHGRYSRYLPERLLARYHEAEADPEKLALEAELAVIDARLAHVLQHVESGESGKVWTDLRAKWQAAEPVLTAGDPTAAGPLVQEIGALISRGSTDSAAWSDVISLIRERTRLVESERKRRIEMQQVVSVEHATALLALLVDAVRQHVHDDEALRAIQSEYARLTGVPIAARGQ